MQNNCINNGAKIRDNVVISVEHALASCWNYLGYPLINNYMQLSPTMKAFGTAKNEDFGDVEETGILVTIADIYPEKKHRHIDSYIPKSGS